MSVSPATPQAAKAFDNDDVARSYLCRPPYAPALYDFLLDRVPQRRRLLDLGCGPGKIAGDLAGRFDEVTALDPSGPMIALGRDLHAGRHPNIRWVHARVEDASLDDAYDLVTAGASIHWMTRETLFPRLADRTPILAVIGGGRAGRRALAGRMAHAELALARTSGP
jgi:SAM-dependent methyltransferase